MCDIYFIFSFTGKVGKFLQQKYAKKQATFAQQQLLGPQYTFYYSNFFFMCANTFLIKIESFLMSWWQGQLLYLAFEGRFANLRFFVLNIILVYEKRMTIKA